MKSLILLHVSPIYRKKNIWTSPTSKEKNQFVTQKTGAQNIVKEIKQYQEKWLQHVQRMDTDYQNKHYSINQKDEET